MRYSRQTILPQIGDEGQEKLQNTTVGIVGVGALGTVVAELLARSGIGKIVLIDRDVIEKSNLQRQVLFSESDVGKSKAIVAKQKLCEINSEICVEAHAIHVNTRSITVLEDVDIVIDCTDNLTTRFLLNDWCAKHEIPWVYGAAMKTSGYVFPILPGGVCLSCFLSEAQLDTCETVGVINGITTSIAAMQAMTGLKLLLGEQVDQELVRFDIWKNDFQKLSVQKRANCPTCEGKYFYLEKEEDLVLKFCGKQFQILGKLDVQINLESLKEKWQRMGEVYFDGVTLKSAHITLFRDGRALIQAKSEQEARSIYSKYVGN